MKWAVKPKTQIFEGLGWYSRFHAPLRVESSGTINEHGNSVVMPVNKALTFCGGMQSMIVPSIAGAEALQTATSG
jgi:hypothetical protein